MMDRKDLRTHLDEAVSGARPVDRLGLTARLIAYCWPGGLEDRYVLAGADWVREWGPRRSGAAVPVCTCASGFCDICN
jgi:hypothetical protein